MLETKRNKLEKAIENNSPLLKVRDLFKDYTESYKRLRNPKRQDFKNYENTYIKYIHYLDRLKEIKK